MRTNNQRSTIEGLATAANADEPARKSELDAVAGAKADKAGTSFTGPVLVADAQGSIASGATASPDVTPVTGRQCFSYSISASCSLGALAGTGSIPTDMAVGGSIFFTFSAAATVTLSSSYKLPVGVQNSVTGAAGEVWRLDFLYRKTANRCSASIIREAT